MSKYTQKNLDTLVEYFEAKFNSSPFRFYDSGPHKGTSYVSRAGLQSNQDAKDLNNFCMDKWGVTFKVFQAAVNTRLRFGNLISSSASTPNVTETPTDLEEQNMVNTIVRLSRYVSDNVMSRKDFDEVISNLYD